MALEPSLFSLDVLAQDIILCFSQLLFESNFDEMRWTLCLFELDLSSVADSESEVIFLRGSRVAGLILYFLLLKELSVLSCWSNFRQILFILLFLICSF